MSSRLLEGKHVIITGAGRGLGEAYAYAAAEEGARVVVSDIDAASAESVAEAISRGGGDAIAVPADVTSWDDCARLVSTAVGRYGKVDGLVNNAGYLETITAGEENEAHIRRHIEVGLYGTYFMSVHALPAMGGRGSIVNVTSGAMAGLRMMSAYAASKGAIASLTFAWATEFEAQGGFIRVNAIGPHADTPMMATGTEAYTAFFGGAPVAPPPSTNAPVVVYLLSDLSEGVNGQIVRIANGSDLMVISHPSIVDSALVRETWSTLDVHDAFNEVLRSRMQTNGQLNYARVEPIEPTRVEFSGGRA